MLCCVDYQCLSRASHRGRNCSEVGGIAVEFGISDKVMCIVHDQASNMVLSMDILFEEKGWHSLRCSVHCLQLCVNAGLSSVSTIDRTVGAAKKLVGHFRHGVVASEALKQRQSQMGLEQKKLIQSCVTRWSSCYHMLSRLLEMRWPISAVLSDETVTKRAVRCLDLKSEQWAVVEELASVLQPFQVAATFLQYEYNSSLSCILPVIHGLDLFLQPSANNSQPVKQFKEKVRIEVRSRWFLAGLDTTSVDVLAPALDPRFRQLTFLDDVKKMAVKDKIKRKMTAVDPSPPARESPRVSSRKSALDVLLGPEEVSDDFLTRKEGLLCQFQGK